MGRRGAGMVLILLTFAACADDSDPEATVGSTATTATTVAGDPTDTDSEGPATDGAGDEDGGTLVAQTTGPQLGVWGSPDHTQPPRLTLSADAEPSGRLVLVVRQQWTGNWYRVELPVAPPGGTGWVRGADVSLAHNSFRIAVDRSNHTLTLRVGDTEVLSTPVALGATDGPGAGTYFVKDLLVPPDVDGGYGPYAYGLSGATNELADFVSGSGVVAIHGTDDPDSLGSDIDEGSIAIDNVVITRLAESIGVPLGTPVEVTE